MAGESGGTAAPAASQRQDRGRDSLGTVRWRLLGVLLLLAVPASAARIVVTCYDGASSAFVGWGTEQPSVRFSGCDLDRSQNGRCLFQVSIGARSTIVRHLFKATLAVDHRRRLWYADTRAVLRCRPGPAGTITSDTGVGMVRAHGRDVYYCSHVSGGVYNGRYRCVGPGCPARSGEFGVNLGLGTPSGPGKLDGLFSRGREKLPSCLFHHNVTGSALSLDVDASWACYVYDGHGGATVVSSGTLRLTSKDNTCTACGCATTPKSRSPFCRYRLGCPTSRRRTSPQLGGQAIRRTHGNENVQTPSAPKSASHSG